MANGNITIEVKMEGDVLKLIQRLLVLATKHCPSNHHDWEEIERIYDALDILPNLTKSNHDKDMNRCEEHGGNGVNQLCVDCANGVPKAVQS